MYIHIYIYIYIYTYNFYRHTGGGRNPAPADGWYTSHYLQGFNHPSGASGDFIRAIFVLLD